MIAKRPPYLEICFRPTIATINEARRLVTNLFAPAVRDADVSDRIALTAHELLENGLKYSLDGSTSIRVELTHASGPRAVTVEAKNLVSPERRAALAEMFAEMERFGHAGEYYQFVIRRTRSVSHGSGLGLARIWAEAEMKLALSSSGDEVCVTATLMMDEATR